MPLHRDQGTSLDHYFNLIRELPMLTADEERANGRRWQRDRDPEGLLRLVEGNLRFVVKESAKFQGNGLDLIDLISEGNLGLLEAAKRYDPERENRFLTYAVWWVRQAIFHALSDHGDRIRLPQKVAGRVALLNRTARKLEQGLGRLPTVAELVQTGPFTTEEVERLQRLQYTINPVSTDGSLGDSELTLGDRMEQTSEPSALAVLEQEALLGQIQASLGLLGAKERRIIALHFGLGGREPMTLERIGQSFQPPISRERVRQLEERALAKLRDYPKFLPMPSPAQAGIRTGT